MKKGALIFAHNTREIDYAKMAIVSGGLAKKHLQVPVTLVTDMSTQNWMKESGTFEKAQDVFEQIILVDRPESGVMRTHSDGKEKVVTQWNNINRPSAWQVTPYERTLLLDCDYFTLSDNLNSYWDVDSDLLIAEKYNDIYSKSRTGYLDNFVSPESVELLWATTVMFTKNEYTKMFFDLVEYVRQNYSTFADLFRYDPRMYRNDISFSVAYHILNGFEKTPNHYLPGVLSVPNKDLLYDVKDEKLVFLVSPQHDTNYCVATIKDRDVHIMNKSSVERNIEKLMELI